MRSLENLLKRCYVPLPDCYRGWQIEIRNFRRELKQELQDSPSLKKYILEIFSESYQETKMAMQEDYSETVFPEQYPFSEDINDLLTAKFWEN